MGSGGIAADVVGGHLAGAMLTGVTEVTPVHSVAHSDSYVAPQAIQPHRNDASLVAPFPRSAASVASLLGTMGGDTSGHSCEAEIFPVRKDLALTGAAHANSNVLSLPFPAHTGGGISQVRVDPLACYVDFEDWGD